MLSKYQNTSASSNKTSKNEGEESFAVLVTVQEKAKTVKWEGDCRRAHP